MPKPSPDPEHVGTHVQLCLQHRDQGTLREQTGGDCRVSSFRPNLKRGRACAPWGSLRCPELGLEGGGGRPLTGVTPAQALYMDAVEYFPDEMQEVVDLMTEKELRVRLPLEELELLLED